LEKPQEQVKRFLVFAWDTGRFRWWFRCLAVLFAAAMAVASRNAINPDGRSYLEVARAYLRHDWAMAVNSYWVPLYSWILTPSLALLKPSVRQEFPLVHLVNLGVFVVCILSFEFFWTQLLSHRGGSEIDKGGAALSDPTLWVLGYTLFIGTMAGLVAEVTPDLALSALIFCGCGDVAEILRTENAAPRFYAWLGLLLGTSYLTKALLFPAAFVFLAVLLVFLRRNVARVGLAIVVFLSLSTPKIFWLSAFKGYRKPEN
jgi:hypothetical protein